MLRVEHVPLRALDRNLSVMTTGLIFSRAAAVSCAFHFPHRPTVLTYQVAFLILIAFPSLNPVSDGVLIIHFKQIQSLYTCLWA